VPLLAHKGVVGGGGGYRHRWCRLLACNDNRRINGADLPYGVNRVRSAYAAELIVGFHRLANLYLGVKVHLVPEVQALLAVQLLVLPGIGKNAAHSRYLMLAVHR